jgi:3-methylcrotonyl-CoA carboxylase alpha subunit
MNINAPMPGKIISVKVKVGDSVKKDQPLLTMESLKMENAIRTRTDGVVKEIYVKVGDQVQTGNSLVSVE